MEGEKLFVVGTTRVHPYNNNNGINNTRTAYNGKVEYKLHIGLDGLSVGTDQSSQRWPWRVVGPFVPFLRR
jgi:hypothetical protein